MAVAKALLARIDLPDFGMPEVGRRFMADALGIDLHSDVLPFSNIPAYPPPFILSPDRAMTVT